MCHVFAGQDPENYRYVTRSVRLNGHATSLRLEAKFWQILDEMAALEQKTTPRFLAILHDEVLEIHGEVKNFSSLLRSTCIIHLQRKVEGETGYDQQKVA